MHGWYHHRIRPILIVGSVQGVQVGRHGPTLSALAQPLGHIASGSFCHAKSISVSLCSTCGIKRAPGFERACALPKTWEEGMWIWDHPRVVQEA